MIVIPDIHGRSFWREAVEGNEQEQIVFLGDYMDPYPYEGIRYADAAMNFDQIIAFKKNHPDNVVLLIGNHDISYMMFRNWARARFDMQHCVELHQRFQENWSLFQLAFQKDIDGKRYYFSHAGISRKFLKECNLSADHEQLVATLNNRLAHNDASLFDSLDRISWYRGGNSQFGSMVWADVCEYDNDPEDLIGDYQVFGHTQLEDAIVTEKFACLDCRRAFRLDEKGIICEISGDPLTVEKAD